MPATLAWVVRHPGWLWGGDLRPVDLTDGYCWPTPKYRNWCAQHAFFEGKKAEETSPRKSTSRTLKEVGQQYPDDIRPLEWTDGFDHARQLGKDKAQCFATCFFIRRVAERDYSHSAPEELLVQVSLQAAQALQTLLAERDGATSNAWLWTCLWQLGCRRTRLSVVSLPPCVRQTT
jgi:hypothetical protein